MTERVDSFPTLFCWTRFGTEAGETIEAILERKERERRENGGVFLWGIGNSVAPAIDALIREAEEPEVLFSPIKGSPRKVDVAPVKVVEWRTGEAMDGRRFPLPTTFHVRGGSGTELMGPRYALVCSSRRPLAISDHGRLSFGSMRNLVSGSPLGASQVTAVVRRLSHDDRGGRDYLIALRASLVEPFFVRLRDPVPVVAGSQPVSLDPSPSRAVQGVADGAAGLPGAYAARW